jgi:hypothetical protein
MFATNIHEDPVSQAPPTAVTGAVFGIGGPVPKIPLNSMAWTPRELALIAFALADLWRGGFETLH